uniref:Uncharacterized protein n=1 Tax=viral metagenome TaxID=1070528 RepID=A0A6C0H385_9ZZZZ
MVKSPSRKSRRRKSSVKKRSRSTRRKSIRRKSPVKKRSRSTRRKSTRRKSTRRKSPVKKRSRSTRRKSTRRKSPVKKRSRSTRRKSTRRKSTRRKSTRRKSRRRKTALKNVYSPIKKGKAYFPSKLDMPAEIEKFATTENKELLEKIYTDFLSDTDIYNIFSIIFPRPSTNSSTNIVDDTNTNFTGCFFISAHGREGTKDRPTILNAIIKKFNNLIKLDENKLKEYLENSVFMMMALGMICIPSPMQKKIDFGFRPNYTTSELDAVIPKTFFNVFNKYNKDNQYKIKLNDENLDLLHSLIKSQLRVNFYKLWSEPSSIALGETEDQELNRVDILMKRGEIWVLKKLTSESLERTYYLSPNKGESIKFYAHEGLHVIDVRDTNKSEMRDETIIDETIDETKRLEIMVEQLKDRLPTPKEIIRFKRKFIPESEDRIPKETTTQEQIFHQIMNEIKTNVWLKLSTIIMLGYILDIKKLYIYDPACRPLIDMNQDPIDCGPRSDRSLKRIVTNKRARTDELPHTDMGTDTDDDKMDIK